MYFGYGFNTLTYVAPTLTITLLPDLSGSSKSTLKKNKIHLLKKKKKKLTITTINNYYLYINHIKNYYNNMNNISIQI